MMQFLGLVFLSSMPGLASAEFYSDLDSRAGDEATALEIKAKDFWQGLMDSAQGLETTRNAELSARVELTLKALPADRSNYNVIVELFNEAVGHLAKADSMLFEEASRSKMTALQRLENGPSGEALCDYVSEFEDYLYTAYTRFVGHKTYEKKLARHILSRLKEAEPALDRAVEMAPQMYEESEKAEKSARKLIKKLGHKKRDEALRVLALDLIGATAKQRVRFQDYLYGSLLSTAQDLAGEKEEASQTVMKASLRGFASQEAPLKPFVQVEAPSKPFVQVDSEKSKAEKVVVTLRQADDLPPLMFSDGVPVDAKPIFL
jgi:hypothetical protein